MFRLTKFVAVALAAIFTIFQIFGDPSRPGETARADTENLTLAGFEGLTDRIKAGDLTARPGEAEAVQIALKAGRDVRDARAAVPTVWRGALNSKSVDDAATPKELWYVSGSKVNLRQGPGRKNPVVTQVTFGTEARVVGRDGKWLQIETTDGRSSGWIYGKYLADQKPG